MSGRVWAVQVAPDDEPWGEGVLASGGVVVNVPVRLSVTYAPTLAGPLPERLAAVAALLLAGMSDNEMAASLGIGLRTLIRRMEQLKAAAGVETRFQLGYVLGAAGASSSQDVSGLTREG